MAGLCLGCLARTSAQPPSCSLWLARPGKRPQRATQGGIEEAVLLNRGRWGARRSIDSLAPAKLSSLVGDLNWNYAVEQPFRLPKRLRLRIETARGHWLVFTVAAVRLPAVNAEWPTYDCESARRAPREGLAAARRRYRCTVNCALCRAPGLSPSRSPAPSGGGPIRCR